MGREEHCKQISLLCVGSAHSISATLGLPPLMACLLSWSILLRLKVALPGTLWSRPWVVCTFQVFAAQVQVLEYSTNAQTPLSLSFVSLPGPSSSGGQVLGKHSHPQVGSTSYRLPHLRLLVFYVYNGRAFSGVPCVSSGELISGCNPPRECRPSRIPRSLR